MPVCVTDGVRKPGKDSGGGSDRVRVRVSGGRMGGGGGVRLNVCG